MISSSYSMPDYIYKKLSIESAKLDMQCECKLIILHVIIISSTNPFRACVLASARVQ